MFEMPDPKKPKDRPAFLDDESAEGEAPPEKPDAGKDAGKADSMLADAEAGGKLAPLTDFLATEGRDDLDAKELLKLAQKDTRTRGKSPEELAKMLGEDPALLDDLLENRSGGMFDRAKDAGPADEPPPGPPPGM